MGYIDCLGNVHFCSLLINTPFNLGNIRRDKFENIWNDKKNWANIEKMIKNNCKRCQNYSYCQGGCPANAILNNHFEKDKRCKDNWIPLCPQTFFP